MCADGAQHDQLNQFDNNIIIFSITIVSRYLIEQCAIYPSSGKWLLPHVQLRGKENLDTLKSVLMYRFEEYDALVEALPQIRNCPIYDMADGKALYLYTGHTSWASSTKPFLLCTCERGMSADPLHVCLGITDEQYKCKIQSSAQR